MIAIIQSKSNLIKQLADNYVAHLTKDYFNSRSALIAEAMNRDPSKLNRLFDAVRFDDELSSRFYERVMRSNNPVDEWFVPLMNAITKRVIDVDTEAFLSPVKENFVDWERMKASAQDKNLSFTDLMLRGIASGCSANLFNEIDKNPPQTDEARDKFNLKTSVIDAYIKRLSSTSLKEDVRRLTWLNAFFRVLSAFFGLIKPSSRADDSFQKPLGALSVEDKVTVLLSITGKVVKSMESAPHLSLFKCLDAFRLHLINIDDEIVAKKELGVPYEDSVNTALNTAIEHLVTELGSEIDQCEEQSESTPLIKELLNKVQPKRDEPDESNAARLTM